MGRNIVLYNQTNINMLYTWYVIFVMAIFWASLVAIILEKCSAINLKFQKGNLYSKKVSLKKCFLISWILIFLAWIPGLIATYPGVYGYDSVYQLGDYLSDKVSLHHPIIHTYFFGFCVETLGNFFNNRQFGFLIYSLIQMVVLSGCFAAVCWYMAKKGLSKVFRIAFLLLFMFLPTNQILSFSSTKDVLYSGFFMLMIMMFMLLVEDSNRFRNKKFLLILLGTIFLQNIFRNQGIYVVLFGLVVGFIFWSKHWKKLLLILFSSMLIFEIYSGPVTVNLLRGEKSHDVHEMMSVPCMQLSRVMINNPEQLTEKEKKKIAEYIPNYMAYQQFEAISDSMKNTFNEKKFHKSPMDFFKLWLTVGLKNPVNYIDAFARLTIGLWYPDMNYRDPSAWHPYWEYTSTAQNSNKTWIVVKRSVPKSMKWLNEFYEKLTYENTYQKVPVIAMLFSSGLMIWIVLLYVAYCIYTKNYSYLLPVSFVIGLWLTLILGPVVLYRYVYPIACAIPVLVTSAVTMNKKRREYNDGSSGSIDSLL